VSGAGEKREVRKMGSWEKEGGWEFRKFGSGESRNIFSRK
jgi:hypothetical protein